MNPFMICYLLIIRSEMHKLQVISYYSINSLFSTIVSYIIRYNLFLLGWIGLVWVKVVDLVYGLNLLEVELG